jgi:hypothetical protein
MATLITLVSNLVEKQTVVLVDRSGKVTFIEKTLYDQKAQAAQSEKKYEFQIEG